MLEKFHVEATSYIDTQKGILTAVMKQLPEKAHWLVHTFNKNWIKEEEEKLIQRSNEINAGL